MAIWYVNNSASLGGEVCAPWQPNHAYALGARCVCRVAYGTTGARKFVFECTRAGTSDPSVEPTWPTAVDTAKEDPIAGGGVEWTSRNPNSDSIAGWDNATCYLHYILNHATIGTDDVIYVDDGHSESVDLGAVYNIKGRYSGNSPHTWNRLCIYCVDKSDDTLSIGAIIHNLSTTKILSFEGAIYSYGVSYVSDYNIESYPDMYGDVVLESEGTVTVLKLTAADTWIGVSSYSIQLLILNSNVEFAQVTNYFRLSDGTVIVWRKGTLVAASGVTNLIDLSLGTNHIMSFHGVNLSAVGANALVKLDVSNCGSQILFERCKLPSGCAMKTGSWYANALPAEGKPDGIRAHHCSLANDTLWLKEEHCEGTIETETTIVRTGGANHFGTPVSWKMVTGTNVWEFSSPLYSPLIECYETFTEERIYSVEGVLDSLTILQDDEIWMELEYPANDTDGLGALVKDRCIPLDAPADQESSTVAWTTTGITNVMKFKLSVTTTVGKKGPITARVALAKQSATVYIDPKINSLST